MSKAMVQRKSTLKKRQDRNPSIGERFSDDETNRRHQLSEKDKQRKVLDLNDIRKTNNNQLGILREILFTERNIEKLKQKTNRPEKIILKNNTVRNGTIHVNKKTISSSKAIDWNQSEEDSRSNNSADEEAIAIKNESVRLSRSNRKDDQQHYPRIRSTSLYSQSHQQPKDVRSTNKVSFLSTNDRKSNGTETHVNTSPARLNKLLVHLTSELNDLELITGFKPNKNDSPSNTCSTTLATALIELTGHVKQCASNSKEINNLKDQLSIVIKSQLDFQGKIENQITTLQTMMQTICQLVNNEIVSNKKSNQNQIDFDIPEPHQNWLNNAQRPYLIPKDTNNAMDELLMFTRRMNNATPLDTSMHHPPTINRHLDYMETIEASKRLTRPTSAMSTNGNDMSRQTQQRRSIDQTSRSSIDTPLSYDMFKSALPNGNSPVNIFQKGINRLGGNLSTVPSASINETILEKIFQERFRLVQQMTELNKQHEMTQEELANLQAKTIQTQTT